MLLLHSISLHLCFLLQLCPSISLAFSYYSKQMVSHVFEVMFHVTVLLQNFLVTFLISCILN
jgi:hypothetical protein